MFYTHVHKVVSRTEVFRLVPVSYRDPEAGPREGLLSRQPADVSPRPAYVALRVPTSPRLSSAQTGDVRRPMHLRRPCAWTNAWLLPT